MTGSLSAVFFLTWLTVAIDAESVRLTITPQDLQFFREKSVSLNCQGVNDSSQWIVMRHVELENVTSSCGNRWGRQYNSSCKMSMTLPWDTGVYWCQSRTDGRVSDKRNLTVTATSTILRLDSTLPIAVGDTMTLSCLDKNGPVKGPVYFHKDSSVIARCPTTNTVTIRNVSKTHEGFYKCRTADNIGSSFSWISVVDQTAETVGVTDWPSNITGNAESFCDIGSLHGDGMNTELTDTDAPTVGQIPRGDRGGLSHSTVGPIPRPPGGLSSYDNLYVVLGGVVLVLMLLAVSYLVFRMYTVTRANITRKNSVTPYTTRRILPLSESKV